MMYDFRGKVVIITGGASGIGFSCAKEILGNGAKAVTIADVNALKGEKAVRELSYEFGDDRVIFVKINVINPGQLAAAFEVTLDLRKTIDIVINNAAVMNDNEWEYEIALNCNGVVQGTLLGLQYMGRDHGGKGGIVINMASLLSLQPLATMPIYVGTKHFVIAFSRSIGDSYHYNRTGVKILTVCPGRTITNLSINLVERPLQLSSDIGKQFYEEVTITPTQSAENVARGVVNIIKEAKNGSVWLSECGEPICEIEIPHWSTFDII